MAPVDTRLLVATLPIPVLVLDGNDVVQAANGAGVTAFTDGLADPVGKNFKDIVCDRVRTPLVCAVDEAKRDHRAAVAADVAMRPSADGGVMNVHVLPVDRDDGTLAALLVIAEPDRDIDRLLSLQLQTANEELHVANEELQARLEELRAVRQVDEERTRFLAMLAHELRNPLAAITNALYVLTRHHAAGNDRVAEQALRIATRQAKSQGRLLDDLLDVSRIVLGKVTLRLEPTDVVKIVRQALEAAEFALRSRAHLLETALPDEPVGVMGDPVRLEQVVANLLGNAVKYTPPGGCISVALSATTDTVTLTVTDTGTGLEPRLLDRVFDLFTQGDAARTRAAGGLGIGLTVARHLVELHGGTIEARSRGLGQGTTFEVRLPLAVTSPITATTPTAPRTAIARRILIVDDNRDARELLRTILEMDGHHVQDAGDAIVAVRVAVETLPDVVLIDIGLPEIDGYEVARRIRKRLGHAMRLIALTGYGDAEARRLSVEAGFDEHLVKPVDPDRLADVLAAA